MNLADAALLQEIRPYELGSRLRAARLARGWTQTELAGDMVSVGYVSRLESGHRRPNAEVLEALAQRLGVSTDQLLRGPTAPEQDELRLALDFAELSLENGEHAEAEVQARQARDRARAIVHEELAGRATYLIARALESQGSVDDAILELEPLVNGDGGAIPRAGAAAIPRAALPAIPRIKAAIALSRCYRESGDLTLAIEAGERVLDELEGSPARQHRRGRAARRSRSRRAYHVPGRHRPGDPDLPQGDHEGRAPRLAQGPRRGVLERQRLRVRARFRGRGDPAGRARPGAARRGAGRPQPRPAAHRAGRHAAAARPARRQPPRMALLDLAAEELRQSSAGVLDIARNDVARARALLLGGDLGAARELSARGARPRGGAVAARRQPTPS